MSNAFIEAEKRHAASVGVPGTLVINSKRYPARIITVRGQGFREQGGTLQTLKLSAVILKSLLPASEIIDATNTTRGIKLQHLETTTEYRIDTGGVNLSPNQVYWSLKCSQPTAQ